MKQKLLTVTMGIWVTAIASASDMADFFTQLNTFSGDFSQTVYQDGQLVQQSKGSVQLKKPLKFRWDYTSPEPMQLISDGERFYHYDIDLAQVTSKPVAEIANSAITTLLNDEKSIDDSFSVRQFTTATVRKHFPENAEVWLEKADLFYEMIPTETMSEDEQTRKVIVGITDKNRLALFYAEDDYGKNTFLFDNVTMNANIADDNFTFSAPDGVDVLSE